MGNPSRRSGSRRQDDGERTRTVSSCVDCKDHKGQRHCSSSERATRRLHLSSEQVTKGGADARVISSSNLRYPSFPRPVIAPRAAIDLDGFAGLNSGSSVGPVVSRRQRDLSGLKAGYRYAGDVAS
jgi:hypothetical protein